MNQNSLDAHNNNIVNGHLTCMQLSVIGALTKIGKPATMHEVADYIGVGVNSISGRFGELKDIGDIDIIGKKQYKYKGRTYKRSLYAIVRKNAPEVCDCESWNKTGEII